MLGVLPRQRPLSAEAPSLLLGCRQRPGTRAVWQGPVPSASSAPLRRARSPVHHTPEHPTGPSTGMVVGGERFSPAGFVRYSYQVVSLHQPPPVRLAICFPCLLISEWKALKYLKASILHSSSIIHREQKVISQPHFVSCRKGSKGCREFCDRHLQCNRLQILPTLSAEQSAK